MKIFVLNTDLFPEKGVLEDALAQLGSDHEVSRYDTDAELSDDDWDRAVRELVSADRIITL
jgi:ribosomal protein L20A (L18A)